MDITISINDLTIEDVTALIREIQGRSTSSEDIISAIRNAMPEMNEIVRDTLKAAEISDQKIAALTDDPQERQSDGKWNEYFKAITQNACPHQQQVQ